MAVNSALIFERIGPCLSSKLAGGAQACRIKYVTIYNPVIRTKQDTVYIVIDPAHFPAQISGESSLMVVLGALEPQVLQETGHECICVPDCGLGRLYERLHEILEYYNVWEETLSRLTLNGGSLDDLCRAAVPYFENPLTVQTSSFELIGVGETELVRYPYAFREGDSDYLSERWISSALRHADAVFQKRGPFQFHYIPEHWSLLYNIFDGEQYSAQICVDGNHRPLCPEDHIRLGIFAKYVEQYLHSSKERSTAHATENRFRAQLAEYAVSGKGRRSDFSVALSRMGWSMDGDFFCCAARLDGADRLAMDEAYLCQRWQAKSGGISFSANGWVYLICRCAADGALPEPVRDGWMGRVGVSDRFSGFLNCRGYFAQAAAAVRIGMRCAREKTVYRFADYRLPYIVRYGVSSLPLYTLIPQGLQRLINYDRENNSDYCRTLQVYLASNLNMTETIGQLYLHRSTVKYRLNKIQEISGIDYTDQEQRLYLEMLFVGLGEQLYPETGNPAAKKIV